MSFNLSGHVRNREHQNLSGRIRPSGRFSFCQIFRKKRKRLEDGTVKNKEAIALLMLRYDAVHGSLYSNWRTAFLCGLLCKNRFAPKTLGSSIAANSHTRAERGSKGISVRQRDVLCWSANSLERIYKQSNMSFLTLTLPELSQADLVTVQDRWSDLVNTVQTYIQRELKKYGCSSAMVGCTEIQLERFENSGRSFPHLHLVFRGRFHARSHWLIKPVRFRDIWRRSVGRFVDTSQYCWDSSENVEQVRKSSGGYLAKYVSKCASKQRTGTKDLWYPSDWIVCSRRLRGLYERLSLGGYEAASVLLSVVSHWRQGMGYKQSIVISTAAYGERKIGEWGWLKGWEVFPDYAGVHSAFAIAN